MLVYDKNQTGVVSCDTDLVAGFSVLKGMDSNGDSILNASDDAWKDLKVWVDKTGEANFQADALHTLNQLGITSINLDATHVNANSNGNTILDDSTFTWANGATGDIAGVYLKFDPNSNLASSSDAAKVNQLIQAMEGFEPSSAELIGVAAANSPIMLASALTAAH